MRPFLTSHRGAIRGHRFPCYDYLHLSAYSSGNLKKKLHSSSKEGNAPNIVHMYAIHPTVYLSAHESVKSLGEVGSTTSWV